MIKGGALIASFSGTIQCVFGSGSNVHENLTAHRYLYLTPVHADERSPFGTLDCSSSAENHLLLQLLMIGQSWKTAERRFSFYALRCLVGNHEALIVVAHALDP